MRIEKLRRESADTRLIEAKADALAFRGGLVQLSSPSFSVADNIITFSENLPLGSWIVQSEGEPIARLSGGETSLTLPGAGEDYAGKEVSVIEANRGLALYREE